MSAYKSSNQHRLLAVALALGTSALGGCFTTKLKSGPPPAPPTVAYDAKWHSGLVYGLAELSGPYDLQKICPGGWAEITTETSFLNGLVQAVTWSIYYPQSVTVQCVQGGAPPAGAPPPAPHAQASDRTDSATAAKARAKTP